jgi:hypothetical protein
MRKMNLDVIVRANGLSHPIPHSDALRLGPRHADWVGRDLFDEIRYSLS